MRKGSLLIVIILLASAFNIGFLLMSSSADENTSIWPFYDLGPAIIQDSYYVRAPGLESPYGLVGDVPGGYSLYSGNPLQIYSSNMSDWIISQDELGLSETAFESEQLFLALGFAIIPIIFIIFLGRKSYGATKTR